MRCLQIINISCLEAEILQFIGKYVPIVNFEMMYINVILSFKICAFGKIFTIAKNIRYYGKLFPIKRPFYSCRKCLCPDYNRHWHSLVKFEL